LSKQTYPLVLRLRNLKTEYSFFENTKMARNTPYLILLSCAILTVLLLHSSATATRVDEQCAITLHKVLFHLCNGCLKAPVDMIFEDSSEISDSKDVLDGWPVFDQLDSEMPRNRRTVDVEELLFDKCCNSRCRFRDMKTFCCWRICMNFVCDPNQYMSVQASVLHFLTQLLVFDHVVE